MVGYYLIRFVLFTNISRDTGLPKALCIFFTDTYKYINKYLFIPKTKTTTNVIVTDKLNLRYTASR